jgi:hypothetical protein
MAFILSSKKPAQIADLVNRNLDVRGHGNDNQIGAGR